MRFFIFPIFLILMQPVKAQQEFSSPAFATAFKKIWDDGQTGFKQESGDKYDAAGNYYYIHRVKTLLPGADSGSIYIPVDVGKPYAFYNMKVATKLQDIQAREKSLVAAVKNAFGSTLYETRKQDTSMGLIYNRTVLYSAPGATVFDKKAIETVTVLVKGKYKLGLAIYGKQPVPAAAPLPDEPMLNNRIQELLIAMMGFFETEKGMEKSKNQYYTEFESKTALYGEKMKIKVRPFETSLNFQLSYPRISNGAAAKAIYDKLKAAFAQTGKFAFKPETVEGTRTWLYASEAGAKAAFVGYTLVIEYYNSESLSSVGFLLTKKK